MIHCNYYLTIKGEIDHLRSLITTMASAIDRLESGMTMLRVRRLGFDAGDVPDPTITPLPNDSPYFTNELGDWYLMQHPLPVLDMTRVANQHTVPPFECPEEAPMPRLKCCGESAYGLPTFATELSKGWPQLVFEIGGTTEHEHSERWIIQNGQEFCVFNVVHDILAGELEWIVRDGVKLMETKREQVEEIDYRTASGGPAKRPSQSKLQIGEVLPDNAMSDEEFIEALLAKADERKTYDGLDDERKEAIQ